MTRQLDEWLARTTEAALEPELPICDPHHHLWEFPTGRYLRDEFLHDIERGHHILETVYIECVQHYRREGPSTLQPVGETEYIESVAAADERVWGRPRIAAGIVGFADLTLGAAVQPVLEAHVAASTRFRGIRYATGWDASPEIRSSHTNPPPGLLRDAAFRAGFACLARLRLTFDAWLYYPQFAELAELARAFPDVTIILDHMGGPLGIGPYTNRSDEVFVAWRRELSKLAKCANVVVKLGGRTMTMSGYGWHRRETPPGSEEIAARSAQYYRACIDLFGPDRCLFESNFPFDRVSCDYVVLWNAYKRLTQPYSASERAALFRGTAIRVYGLASY
jgi:predicted TIM-barrel fold metal-dependent hydrolase